MNKLILVFFGFLPLALAGQLKPGPVVAGVEADINYLSQGFLSPLAEALNSSANNGWYHTAKTKEKFQFDFSLSPMVVLVPEEKQTFIIQNSALQELKLVDPNNNVTPTAFGSNEPGVALEYDDPAIPTSLDGQRFNMPAGYGINFMPSMTFQASVGLFFDTDINLRYLPEINVPEIGSSLSLWGLGLKHNWLRWIPGAEEELPFSSSLFFGTTSFSFSQIIPDGDDQNQELVVSSTAYTARLLLSRELGFITIYGGAGYNGGSTRVQMLGEYSYVNPYNLTNPETTIKDPVDFRTNGGTGYLGNIGLRASFLWVMFLHVDYTFGPYDALTAGLGAKVDL